MLQKIFLLFLIQHFIRITVPRPTLPAVVCANPDIIRNMFRQNPERVRMLARTFGFGELPDNLTAENLDISTFCGSTS